MRPASDGEGIRVALVRTNVPGVSEVRLPADLKEQVGFLQNLVGGNFDVLSTRADGLEFWLNDDGIATCMPNRAIFATADMESAGYLSQIDFKTPVRAGGLYSVIFGDFVVARADGDGGIAPVTDADLEALSREFADPLTGPVAVRAIAAGCWKDLSSGTAATPPRPRGGLSPDTGRTRGGAAR